ncbi:MAG: alginate export family protein [Myxococcales bacterium]
MRTRLGKLAGVLVALLLTSPAARAEESPRPAYAAALQLGPVGLVPHTEVRSRFESRSDLDLDRSNAEDPNRLLLRTRIGATLSWGVASAFVEGVDARELMTPPADRRDEATLDVHEAWAEVRRPFGTPFFARIGRQELALGSKRLVDCSSWGNRLRAFDMLRLGADGERWRVDAFAGRVVVVRDRELDTWKAGENFWGVFSTLGLGFGASADLFVLGLSQQARADEAKPITGEDGVIGSARKITPGARLFGSALSERLGYEAEAALQLGNRANDQVLAYAGRLGARWTVRELPAAPWLGFELSYASGDEDPNDGRLGRFAPVFGSTHGPYGLIDLFRWQNMREAALFFGLSPGDKVKLTAEYHAFWIASVKDAWFNASGSALRRAEDRSAPSFAGNEFDLLVSWQPMRVLAFEAGFAWFSPGGFARATGAANAARSVYLQAALSY